MIITSLLLASASVAGNSDKAILIAEIVMAIMAVLAFGYTLWQTHQNRKEKRKKDSNNAVDEQVHISGEYLRRSLDAFDELVTSLQTEVGRMTTERNEARRLAEEVEQRLTKEINVLKKEIRALRRVLTQNGIKVPANIITED